MFASRLLFFLTQMAPCFAFTMKLATCLKRTSTRAILRSGEFCSHHVALSAKIKLYDSAFVG
jgi:hypothetical protein